MFHQKTSSLRPFAPHGDTWATLDLINLSIYQLKTIGLLSEAARAQRACALKNRMSSDPL